MQRKVNLNKNEFQKLSAKRSKLKFAFAIISLLIILVLIGAGIGFNWYKGNLEAPSIAGNNISFEVKEGDTLQSIAPSLEEKGIIKSTLALKIYLRLNNLNPQIKAGKYELPTNKKLEEIIELLENGVYTSTAKVTIIEGSKSEDIAEIIDLKMQSTGNDYNFDKDQFMDIVLNPDQYQFKSSIQEFLDENKPIRQTIARFFVSGHLLFRY
ncbi:MAG: hypothetical protein KatS3mg086_178 [Candidatus Dojkabacteria bacterium]|nr:MAG: hypothetical protein KatS3mg086_178 [Candidatus Dojkabacteria bacterium]